MIPDKAVNKSATTGKKEEKFEKKVNESGEQLVPINQVEPNREQPRKEFDEDALLELARFY